MSSDTGRFFSRCVKPQGLLVMFEQTTMNISGIIIMDNDVRCYMLMAFDDVFGGC